MSEFIITKAERKASPVSVFIQGVSGSGKTYSGLLLARGLAGPGEKIGIIDTEGGRSLIYADDPDIGGFDHMPFSAPFDPDRFSKAADAAVKAGWKAIMIDSMSLEHDGEGGVLDMAEEEAQRLYEKNPKNFSINMQKWTQPKLAHKRMLNHLCGLPVHVIGCFRETLTTDFDATDERGKKTPTTVLSVVAEKNTLFSFELHAAIDKDHKAHWSRIPKPYLPAIAQGTPITVAMGALLAGQCAVGTLTSQPASQPDTPTDDEIREEAIRAINDTLDSEGIDVFDFNSALADLTKGKYNDFEKLPTKNLDNLSRGKPLADMIAAAKAKQEGGGK